MDPVALGSSPQWLAVLRVLPFVPIVVGACHRGEGSLDTLASMELVAEDLPRSTTNARSDDVRAADLGRRLFFDAALSVDGSISCSSCHSPANGFSDPRRLSVGVRGQLGDRHAMPILAAALQSFVLWDGRADSLWSQPLKAIENEREMDLTRVELAHRIGATYRAEYETLFGAFPSLETAPLRAKPSMPEWEAMPESLRDDVNRVAANVGKSIEAYERTLLCADTRFDRWVRGDIELTETELAGAEAFVESGCGRCHSGPAFSDGEFHNVGVPSSDRGRVDARVLLESDPFNGAGAYSDDRPAGAEKLASVGREAASVGAFRTSTLRGVGQRRFFGHAGHQPTLEGFIRDVYRRGDGRGQEERDGRTAAVGVLDPLLEGVNVRGSASELVAFLRALDCPPTPSSLE